jgi:hypothetical protein
LVRPWASTAGGPGWDWRIRRLFDVRVVSRQHERLLQDVESSPADHRGTHLGVEPERQRRPVDPAELDVIRRLALHRQLSRVNGSVVASAYKAQITQLVAATARLLQDVVDFQVSGRAAARYVSRHITGFM